MAREGGASTPRLVGSITAVSGVLDRPPEPVIGLEGETRWRTMTAHAPYDSRISRSLRPSLFNSFFTALDAATSPWLA